MMDAPPIPLDRLAVKHRTDKASWGHDFASFYDEILWRWRYDKISIVEIGVKFGSSLCMWEDGFPKATVFGLDNNWRIRPSVQPKRAKLVTMDASDRGALEAFCQEHGPFHLVVDDSAHTSTVTRAIVETFWPDYIRPQGWLVIEDINSGYKVNVKNGEPSEQHDQIDYCMSLVRNVCHSGKLSRCGPSYWEHSSEFDKAIRQIIYRPGILAMERR